MEFLFRCVKVFQLCHFIEQIQIMAIVVIIIIIIIIIVVIIITAVSYSARSR